ncbi:MAG: hypothetical protein E6R13_01580 [Spirochaetes bacterium]|nr:MAG: hypothetical protein E6R13_01580 [Spirochaetota bacterium]
MSLLDFFSGGNNDAADRATRDALNQYSTIVAPSLEELQVQYEELKNAGLLTPELEQVFQQQASEMQNISTDPRLKQAQLNALSSLEEIGQNGMTLQDKANLQKIQTQIGQQERGAREAILQTAARRGTSGSGFELA